MPSTIAGVLRCRYRLVAGLVAIAVPTGCLHHAAPSRVARPTAEHGAGPGPDLRGKQTATTRGPLPDVDLDDPASLLGGLPGPAGWCRPVLALAARLGRSPAEHTPRPPRIGVLLPLRGAFRAYGRRALAGIELGAGLFDRHGAGGDGVQLVIRDTRGDPARAVQHLEELVRREEVVAVVGPMFADATRAAASRAGELEVPLLVLSGLPRITSTSGWVLRNFLTLEAQAACLVDHAAGARGIEHFAVLHPATPYGASFAEVFENEVAGHGGRLLVKLEFDPATRDFREVATALRKQLPREVAVGLFVPADHRTIALIAPALAWADVIIDDGRPARAARIRRSLDRNSLHRVVLLGGNGFHHPELLDWAGRYVEGAVFCDGFFGGSDRPAVQEFCDAHVANFQDEPGMVAAQARDTMRLVMEALRRADWPDRTGVRNALLELQGFEGATGTISIGPEGDARKRLYLLTVRDRQIVEWIPHTIPDS